MRSLFLALMTYVTVLTALANAAERRVALVIGVGAYRNVPTLPNPPRDAKLIAPILQTLGFDTELVTDPVDRGAMEAAVRRFSKRMEGATATLFYYAGHGLQVGGRNYLMPVNARVEQEADLRWEALDLQTVLDQMDAPGRVNLVFLDACRDNPLSRSLAGRMGTRSTLVGQGLAREDRTGAGTLIAYATDPGDVAADGVGVNSPFTQALAKYIVVPGLEVRQVMTRVRNDVVAATSDRPRPQRPWDNSSLDRDFYFVPPSAPSPPVPIRDDAVEVAFWTSIQASTDARYFEAYLTQYPQGQYVVLARLRLDALKRVALNVAPPAARSPEPAAPPSPAIDGMTRDCPDCPELVLLPEGSYTMGAPPGEEEREKVPAASRGWSAPRHPVTISNRFYMGKFAVTRGEYAAFIAEAGERPEGEGCWNWDERAEKWGQKKGASWREPGIPQQPDQDRHPVICVNHEDAEAYVAWLSKKTGKSYRLPSEAEWEYAARAVTSVAAPSPARYWGNDRGAACLYANVADATLARRWRVPRPDPDQYFACGDGFAYTAPVGSFKPNVFGLHDMLGNVWQWTRDCWHDTYRDSPPADGSAWITTGDCGRRVLRGGSWDGDPGDIRSGARSGIVTGNRYVSNGFRVARTHSSP